MTIKPGIAFAKAARRFVGAREYDCADWDRPLPMPAWMHRNALHRRSRARGIGVLFFWHAIHVVPHHEGRVRLLVMYIARKRTPSMPWLGGRHRCGQPPLAVHLRDGRHACT